jgi:hypothetical protein
MEAHIFRNKFILNFSKIGLNEAYSKLKMEDIKKQYKLISFLLLISSVAAFLENLFFKNKTEGGSLKFVIYCSLANSIYYLFSFISGFFIQCPRKLLIFHYLNYLGIILTCGFLRYPLIHFVKPTPVVLIVLLLLEILARIFWVVLNVMEFYENFILNLIEICLIWIAFYPTSDPSDKGNYILFNFVCYSFFFLLISLFFYIIEKQRKISFYFQSILKDQVKSLNDIFDKTSIGFLSVKKNKIIYMNSFLMKSLKKFKYSVDTSEILSKLK